MHKPATLETILERQPWTENLFSFKTTRPAGFTFTPGQFARLGLELDGELVWRAYSIVSDVQDPQLEFYSVVIPDGPFTQALNQRGPGDTLYIEQTSFGFMTVERLPAGRDVWLMGTGTGLAPYISILRAPDIWKKFRNIVLVHGARIPSELTYGAQLEAFRERGQATPDAANFYLVQAVTRVAPGAASSLLQGRITELFSRGALEKAAGMAIEADHTRIMLCGNPSMIEDMRTLLRQRGLRPCRAAANGQYLAENYW